tara:strand:- start:198 stop:860 length:663 start_codon:yes stop_codon:yes gene_type:complete
MNKRAIHNDKISCKFCGKQYSKFGYHKHEIVCSSNPNRKDLTGSNSYKGGKPGKNQYNYGYVMKKSTKKKLSDSMKEINKTRWTAERRQRNSLLRSKYLEEYGHGGFPNVKNYKICNNNGQEFCVRGTWELFVAKELNKHKINWVRKIYLNYTLDDNVTRTYTPDFYLPEQNLYIEIKGFYSDKDKKKMKTVNEQNNLNIVVIQGKSIDCIKRQLSNIIS